MEKLIAQYKASLFRMVIVGKGSKTKHTQTGLYGFDNSSKIDEEE